MTSQLFSQIATFLEDAGHVMQRTVFDKEGDWRILIAMRGGLLRGLPMICYHASTDEIILYRRTIFRKKKIKSWLISESKDSKEFITELKAELQQWP